MDADPLESHNLAADPKYAEVLGEMRKSLVEWGRKTADDAPERLTPDEFDRQTGDPLPNRIRPRPAKKKTRAAGAGSGHSG